MEDPHRAQLALYVQQAYKQGASIDAIRAELLKSGWREDVVEPVIAEFWATNKPADPHRTRNAVLWIVGPVIAFIIIAFLQLIIRFFWVRNDDMGVTSIFQIVINIFSVVVGVIAVPMLVVGPIVGFLKLSKK